MTCFTSDLQILLTLLPSKIYPCTRHASSPTSFIFSSAPCGPTLSAFFSLTLHGSCPNFAGRGDVTDAIIAAARNAKTIANNGWDKRTEALAGRKMLSSGSFANPTSPFSSQSTLVSVPCRSK